MRVNSVRHLAIAALAGLAFMPSPRAEETSAWTSERNVRARMVAGASTGADRWAAIEIVLDPGFKTYWRDPGESGLPPSLTWTGSTNAETIEVLWPAPVRLEDAAGIANGYRGRVVLPLKVDAGRADAPSRLAVQAEFGICHDICIPVRMALALDLVPGEVTEQPDGIVEALERVPRRQAAGASGPLSILSIARAVGTDKPMLDVTVRAPIASAPQLFVEAPPNWFMAVSDPQRAKPGTPETRLFQVEIAERPRETPAALPLTLTLAAEGSAVESTLTLDAAELAR